MSDKKLQREIASLKKKKEQEDKTRKLKNELWNLKHRKRIAVRTGILKGVSRFGGFIKPHLQQAGKNINSNMKKKKKGLF